MTRVLEPVDLDDRGAAYLRTRLSELAAHGPSLSALCDVLAERLRTDTGTVFTIAPVGVGREQLYAFESGGFLPANPDPSRVTHLADGSTMAPIESLFEEEFTRLRDQLSRIPNLVCVVVDPLPRRGDPCLHGYAETIFYAGDDVYHVIRSATSEAAAERALSASPPWSSLNVLSTIAPTLDDNRHTELSELRKCAGAVVEMSCGAYDGEGYVNWRRG